MTKEQLFQFISEGREIEFEYKGKKYSITYSPSWEDEYISFCEFYQYTSDVKTPEELIAVEREGVTVLEMLESLPEDKIWIY
ncbi:MAG: hypothetical protein K5769_11145 [Pseudobutyrivibrio sp.]|nr:hypothetical protein [Pseudobutyrivibrio sp.]